MPNKANPADAKNAQLIGGVINQCKFGENMSKSPSMQRDEIADKRDWFSSRPFPVFIIAAWC
jgi:hypothetical protein